MADAGGRDAGDFGDDGLNLAAVDGLLALLGRADALGRAGFVDDVDGLVGQVAVGDVARSQLHGRLQGGGRVNHAVMRLKARAQAIENFHGFGHGRLGHFHFLEAPRKRRVFFKNAPVFSEGGGANALELPAGKSRLEQVGSVQRAAGSRARANQRVDFVNEEDGVGLVAQALEHALEALLEVAPVFGACQQRAHVQRVNDGAGQHFRHFAFGDAPGQPFGNGGFAYARLAHQQRVVFAAAAKNLDGALQLVLAANKRVNAPFARLLVEIDGVLLQRRLLFVFFSGGTVSARSGFAVFGVGFVLAHAVGDEVHRVQPRHALLVQEIDGVRVFLAKDGHQHVGARDFLLAAGRGLHMHDGALDHALKAQRGLRVHLAFARHLRGVVGDEA